MEENDRPLLTLGQRILRTLDRAPRWELREYTLRRRFGHLDKAEFSKSLTELATADLVTWFYRDSGRRGKAPKWVRLTDAGKAAVVRVVERAVDLGA